MGSTTARCFTLFPLLLPRPSPLRLIRLFSTTHHHLNHRHRHLFLSPLHCLNHQSLHTHSLKCDTSSNTPPIPNPWPEWLDFVNKVTTSNYSANHTSNPVSEFVDHFDLPLHFLRPAFTCLRFASLHPHLLWSLPREDIQVVVNGSSPFLFKEASATTRRMEYLLGTGINDVLDSDKPTTVDLMRFLLSYVGMAIVSPENFPLNNKVESSVRKLFSELARSNGISAEFVAPMESQFDEGHGQPPRSFGNNIEMKRGDWTCPRCSFMNFAKNSKCLDCEEPWPKKLLTGREWECPRCNFFNFGRNAVCLRCDCKKPILDTSQGPNLLSGDMEQRLAGTEEKHPSWFTKIKQLEKFSDKSGAIVGDDFPENKIIRNLVSQRKSDGDDVKTPGEDSNIKVQISEYLDEVLGESFLSNTSNKGADFGASSRVASPTASSGFASPQNGHISNAKSNEKPPGQMGDIEREQTDKSGLHDVKGLPRAISDEGSPEIMPMPGGENRFVFSKKKDRSLTSPMYKRRVAMEHAGNNNYVPFVPFPPGYFAQDKAKDDLDSTQVTSYGSDKLSSTNHQSNALSSDSGGAGEVKEVGASNFVYNVTDNVKQTSLSSDSQVRSSSPVGSSKTGSVSGSNSNNDSSQFSENLSIRDTWRGKSLEGSAVKEPDPLDMSEEAKAERWFRRVAQIKDISELSQIPDEDFPSIMPMRKGVNRFVVTKRKTPLERRLTSPRYQRNLPTVSSDPVKKENDTS